MVAKVRGWPWVLLVVAACSGKSVSSSDQSNAAGDSSGGAAGIAGGGSAGRASGGAQAVAGSNSGEAGMGDSGGAAGETPDSCQPTCSNSQRCIDATCRDIVCVPNRLFCAEGDVWSCNDDGTTAERQQACGPAQFCIAEDGAATCSDDLCLPNSRVCVGQRATICKADGSGPKSGGKDCSSAGMLCVFGECRPQLCTVGQKLCADNAVNLCIDDGTARLLLAECGTETVCDPARTECVTKQCEPGTFACQGYERQRCNELGTGYETVANCLASNSACVTGECKPLICQPDYYYCENNQYSLCTASGTEKTFVGSCGAVHKYCVNGSVNKYAVCNELNCTPSASTCVGNVLTTCNADGSGTTPGGIDCTATAGNICAQGKCTPKVCEANSTLCANGNIQRCDSWGASYYEVAVCGTGDTCDSSSQIPRCVEKPCSPGQTGCVWETFGQCNADGSSLSNPSDCGSIGKLCTAQGCTSTAIDTLGVQTDVATGNEGMVTTVLNLLEMHSARQLNGIDAYLSLPGPRSLTWLVYEQLSTGEYELKASTAMTATQPVTGWVSSSALSFPLTAGKKYLVGVRVLGGSFSYSFSTYAGPRTLPFARVTWMYATTFAATYPSYIQAPNKIFYSRLSTSAPAQ